MIKRTLIWPVLLLASGCVSTGAFKAQQEQAAFQRKRADGLEARLKDLQAQKDAADKAAAELKDQLKAANDQLKTAQDELKAVQDQLASVQKSNDDLRQSLEAKKGELTKKVAALTKEKDDLAKSLADASKERDALAQQLASVQAEKAALEKAKADLESAKAAELDAVKKNYDSLAANLKSEIAAGALTITQLKGKLTVNMVDRILFDSGSAQVKRDGRKVLDRVGSALNSLADKDIRIEGHTDDVPIKPDLQDKYPTNWELSTARATAVARYLQDNAGVDPKRLVAAGFSEFRPVASNDTPEGRAENRRIEIVLVPRD